MGPMARPEGPSVGRSSNLANPREAGRANIGGVARRKTDAARVDLANERVILATIAKDAGVRRRLVAELVPESFGDERHRAIFRAATGIARLNLEWSEDAVMELSGGDSEAFGGFAYLRKLLAEYEPTPNVGFHVERLRLDAAKFAVGGEGLAEVQAMCIDKEISAESLAAKLRELAGRIEGAQGVRGQRGSQLRGIYYDELRQRRIVGDVVEGTGFELLDRRLSRGLMVGLSAVVGRPGHGKTTFLANLIANRLRAEKTTYVCGWEMIDVDYVDMIVAAETGVPAEDLARKVRDFDAETARRVQETVEWATRGDLLAVERNPFPALPKLRTPWEANARNLDHFEATIARECGRYQVFAVDVFSKLLADRRPDAVSESLVRIRETAKRCGVHVMLLHHLNRDGADAAPSLETIKGAGAWEEECDLILGIDRPILRAPPGRRRKQRDVLDVHVLKQRKGAAPLCFRHDFDGPRFRLSNEGIQDVSVISGGGDE